MEGRLHETSLAQPGLSLAGEESIAEYLSGRLHVGKVLRVVAMILLEHALHMIGVIEHVGRPEQEAEADHVAIPVPNVKGKADGVALERGGAAKRREAARTWRLPGPRSSPRFGYGEYRLRHA